MLVRVSGHALIIASDARASLRCGRSMLFQLTAASGARTDDRIASRTQGRAWKLPHGQFPLQTTSARNQSHKRQ
jgi:hypothetical protein